MSNRTLLLVVATAGFLLLVGGPAAADHTDPDDPQSQPTEGPTQPGDARGEGEWEHVFHAPPNPGSDHFYFTKDGQLYVAHGTIGQGNEQHVGQRIFRLMDADGELDPDAVEWVADHGSAACTPGDPARTLGLQHDQGTTPPDDPELLFDSTDATGRCHDTPSGGIEIVDISGLGEEGFEVREVHLTRFASTSHTLTVDDAFPWIVWSNNSGTGSHWMDFMDIRSCLTASAGGTLPDDANLETKREGCRPVAYRVPFKQEWTQRTVTLDGDPQGPGNGCHDVTSVGTTVYCSGVEGEVIIDIAGMIDENGDVRGTPLPCEVKPAEPAADASTTAMVTDCQLGGVHPSADAEKEAWQAAGSPQAEGWDFLGNFNHPGRPDNNNNFSVPASEGVAISHQTMPLNLPAELGRFMVVSDERGGGVIPHGASCGDPDGDVFWHGGLHFFDITDPANIRRAAMLDDEGEPINAFWRGEVLFPTPTFCDVHVFHHVAPDEQRLVMAYYSQGLKILDYRLDDNGFFEFEEVGAFRFPGPIASNTWTANVFDVRENDDGTRTYFIGASDINRGFDLFTFTHEPHPIQQVGEVDRVAGPNRFETAVAVSQEQYDTSDVVLLARADDYADALAGASLGTRLDAPMLLTHTERLPSGTEDEIDRLEAEEVVLLGGPAAISKTVEAHLVAKGLTVRRIGGPNRFSTAALIADELGGAFDRVFLTEGIHPHPTRGWPDAVSAAPYAAFSEQPVLLVAHGILPPETAQALRELGVEETVVVGGPAAVSDEVVEQIRDAGHGPRRLAGRTRFETSVAVYHEAVAAGMRQGRLWLATGGDWPDALTAGAVIGTRGDTFALVDGTDIDSSSATRDLLQAEREAIRRVTLLGGPAAISEGVRAQVEAILQGEDHRAVLTSHDTTTERTPAVAVLPVLTVLPVAALLGRRRRRHR